jgi:hypothetical protein
VRYKRIYNISGIISRKMCMIFDAHKTIGLDLTMCLLNIRRL